MTKNGQPTPLAPLAFPLVGSHLIEASAGTGKTYTIAMLYVRLVLGHGGGSAFPGGPLTPPDILVVTFTEAATEELRDRIRARLAEAAARFREDPAGIRPPDDPDPLHHLRAGYPPDQWPVCARRLELAAEWMDEAAVSTIHGWCNRMLREHAFDSGSPFLQNLETDQRALAAETVRDYWRTFVYPLDQDGAATFLACWSAPDALQRVVGPLLGHAGRLPEPDGPANVLRAMREERQQRLAELKRPWAAWSEELRDLFDKAKAAKAIDGRKLRSDWYGNWLDALRDWATMPDHEMPDLGKGWDRLKREGIAEAWTKGTPPDHPAFEAISRLKPALEALPNPKPALLAHAVRWIARTLDEARRRRAEIDFDDLLTGLDAALRGPLGDRLADIIRRQFPVALVDEFQDTDPVQYRIFERVYQVAENRQDCALVLIGDPKQAIYAFRGADIHTYLKARRAVGNRVFTLDTNFRSTGAMVEAANHCFRRAEEEEGG
ncbi:MAG: UvrD-helicase domain-containing protein, partial [Rhodocyclaceae bacterium]|nr:UvrD-helicase domain-containing protein [Rhodocyclaceae bacterium]